MSGSTVSEAGSYANIGYPSERLAFLDFGLRLLARRRARTGGVKNKRNSNLDDHSSKLK